MEINNDAAECATIKLENISKPSNNIQINSSILSCGSYSQAKTLTVDQNNGAAERLKIFNLFRVKLCWKIL